MKIILWACLIIGVNFTIYALEPKRGGLQGNISGAFIKQFLPLNPVIVEAGAHNGDDTVQMASLWPAGKIHAFEPVPKLFRKLKNACSRCHNVVCYKVALSNKVGIRKFYLSDGWDQSSSLFKPKEHLIYYPTVNFKGVINVPSMTLDKWAQLYKIKKVDFLYLDLQGAEGLVLRASPAILKTVQVIFTEIAAVKLYEGSELYSSFKRWLERQGFQVVREDWWGIEGNALFVRKK
jgi:2-O-methyltransferase